MTALMKSITEMMDSLRQGLQQGLRGGLYISMFVALLWLIELINSLLDHRLNSFGLYPRDTQQLEGLLLWVFLHGDFRHLTMNTMPLLLLGWFVALRGPLFFIQISLFITLAAGIAVWLFARESWHIGASGLVFGYFGFLVLRALTESSLTALLLGAVTLIYYGGLLVGVLPGADHISWEAHLAGLLAGLVAARVIPTRLN